MVRRDVGEHGGPNPACVPQGRLRPLRPEQLQLKAACFPDQAIAGTKVAGLGQQRAADVAANVDCPFGIGGLHQGPGQGGRGGFAVAAGDNGGRCPRRGHRQHGVVDHRNAAPAGCLHNFQVGRHPCRQGHQTASGQQGRILAAETQPQVGLASVGSQCCQVDGGTVAAGHVCPLPVQEAAELGTLSGQAEHDGVHARPRPCQR